MAIPHKIYASNVFCSKAGRDSQSVPQLEYLLYQNVSNHEDKPPSIVHNNLPGVVPGGRF